MIRDDEGGFIATTTTTTLYNNRERETRNCKIHVHKNTLKTKTDCSLETIFN